MVLLKQGQVISMLQFDKQGLANELLNNLKIQLEYACIAWETEVYNKLRHPFIGVNAKAEVNHEIKEEANTIIAYLKANTYVLADSYGTGSLMLKDNPGYAAYKNSGAWNKYRVGNAISGRPEEDYVDLFGRKRSSSGTMKGRNIEGWKMMTGFKIQPVVPSYAIQMANKWLHETYLPNAYKLAVRETNFAKYLIES